MVAVLGEVRGAFWVCVLAVCGVGGWAGWWVGEGSAGVWAGR